MNARTRDKSIAGSYFWDVNYFGNPVLLVNYILSLSLTGTLVIKSS